MRWEWEWEWETRIQVPLLIGQAATLSHPIQIKLTRQIQSRRLSLLLFVCGLDRRQPAIQSARQRHTNQPRRYRSQTYDLRMKGLSSLGVLSNYGNSSSRNQLFHNLSSIWFYPLLLQHSPVTTFLSLSPSLSSCVITMAPARSHICNLSMFSQILICGLEELIYSIANKPGSSVRLRSIWLYNSTHQEIIQILDGLALILLQLPKINNKASQVLTVCNLVTTGGSPRHAEEFHVSVGCSSSNQLTRFICSHLNYLEGSIRRAQDSRDRRRSDFRSTL